ncbi:hypothetical protein HHL16_03695 [Pseudoflavitalea sp. G-6-1-2]|uniref:hypothetical protein n=1 Tax=Pseudoflavitalea sp. G-6-1-2 TaxID=2728841 RepID=UPI00146C0C03|nr:hypothetical protein [Pseudoflavitalea sp. G-6-1-2]NML19960.1 hypothetical protein [Pseudoflavitalea sp. G-6-1-2]
MKSSILTLLFLSFTILSFSQESDFIILKKKNNRTVATYTAGSFLSCKMHNGFELHGFISKISNDSIYVMQQEIRMFGTEFGSTLDTVFYRLAFDYRQIKRFNYEKGTDRFGRASGFSVISAPGLMMVGGVGFIALESINTLIRGDSFSDNNKLVSLGIAAGVAAAGYFWMLQKTRKENSNGKMKVVYVKAGSIKFNPAVEKWNEPE